MQCTYQQLLKHRRRGILKYEVMKAAGCSRRLLEIHKLRSKVNVCGLERKKVSFLPFVGNFLRYQLRQVYKCCFSTFAGEQNQHLVFLTGRELNFKYHNELHEDKVPSSPDLLTNQAESPLPPSHGNTFLFLFLFYQTTSRHDVFFDKRLKQKSQNLLFTN